MTLTPEEIEQLADEYVAAEYEGLNDREALLRVWRRVRCRFEAVWDPEFVDPVDQETIRHEVARVLKHAHEDIKKNLTMAEQILRRCCTHDRVVQLDNSMRQLFGRPRVEPR